MVNMGNFPADALNIERDSHCSSTDTAQDVHATSATPNHTHFLAGIHAKILMDRKLSRIDVDGSNNEVRTRSVRNGRDQ
jgi:hypothetical protein